MRLFVALPIPDDVREAVAAATDPLRGRFDGLRWTRPEGWHLTVAFLGEVPDERAGEVGSVVTEVARGHVPIALELAEPGRFGRRVLWAGIDDDPPEAVAALGEQVQSALVAADLPVKQQSVHAHLTLARAGRGPVTDEVVDAVGVPRGSWVADAVGVWWSHLGGNKPARYEEVASAALGA